MWLFFQDDENAKLSAKLKELEDERARLQKTTNIQQTQIEKHRALAEESDKKCDGLQLQVSALDKVCTISMLTMLHHLPLLMCSLLIEDHFMALLCAGNRKSA